MAMIHSPWLIQSATPPCTLLVYTSECSHDEHNTIYTVLLSEHCLAYMSLVDRGANGGICDDNVRPVFLSDRTIDIHGIDNHQIPALSSIGTFGSHPYTRQINTLLPPTGRQWCRCQRQACLNQWCQIPCHHRWLRDSSWLPQWTGIPQPTSMHRCQIWGTPTRHHDAWCRMDTIEVWFYPFYRQLFVSRTTQSRSLASRF